MFCATVWDNGVVHVSARTPESWTSMYPGVIEMPNAGTPESCKCSGSTTRFALPGSTTRFVHWLYYTFRAARIASTCAQRGRERGKGGKRERTDGAKRERNHRAVNHRPRSMNAPVVILPSLFFASHGGVTGGTRKYAIHQVRHTIHQVRPLLCAPSLDTMQAEVAKEGEGERERDR